MLEATAVLIPLLAGNIYYYHPETGMWQGCCLNPFISREHLLLLTCVSMKLLVSLNPFISREHLLRIPKEKAVVGV